MIKALPILGALVAVHPTPGIASNGAGQCSLQPDCSKTQVCPDGPLELEWKDGTTLTIDGQTVEITRIEESKVLDKISLRDTEWTIKANGPVILVFTRNLSGSIKPNDTAGHVTATFRDTSKKRYSDYVASWRAYSGLCEELF